MAIGDMAYLQHSAVIAVDWIGFLCLAMTSIYLFYKLTGFKGPDRDHDFFMGYNEGKMLSIFVNLFAAMAYWARICSHVNGDVGPAANVVAYKYLDYLLTCPLLTLDLLWSLNLPYKFTYAGFVFCCIICAFMCSAIDGTARYMWFGFGISMFGFTWYRIITIVKIRLDQFVSKEAKQVRASLKIACMTYFGIWCGYPTLWLLHELGIISDVMSAVLHTVFDVLAKSLYGFALLSFVLKGEKRSITFLALTERPGKDDTPEEFWDGTDEGDDSASHFGDPHLPSATRRQGGGTIVGGSSKRRLSRNSDLEASNFWHSKAGGSRVRWFPSGSQPHDLHMYLPSTTQKHTEQPLFEPRVAHSGFLPPPPHAFETPSHVGHTYHRTPSQEGPQQRLAMPPSMQHMGSEMRGPPMDGGPSMQHMGSDMRGPPMDGGSHEVYRVQDELNQVEAELAKVMSQRRAL